jgi:hypothetical protein
LSGIHLGIDWKTVQPMPQTLKPGDYTFTLLGAATNDKNGRLMVQTSIASGEFEGKPFTFTYPDFYSENGKWAIPEFKRLCIALGNEEGPFEGETEAAFLNRAAGNKFSGRIKLRSYIPADGDGQAREVADLVLGSVKQVL